MKVDKEKIWKEYRKSVDYKNTEGLYETSSINERYYASDQWSDVKSNGLPKPVFNFLEQMVDVKVSTVMANQISIHRMSDELSKENKRVELASKAFSKMDDINWERTNMKDMNERMLLDSALSGLGVSHWFWDNTIRTGNDFVTQGDISGELVDSVNIGVGNPAEVNIQKQDYIVIDFQKTVKQVRKMAKANDVDEEKLSLIRPDSQTISDEFDKLESVRNNRFEGEKGLVTVILKMWKENVDGESKMHFTKTTRDLVIKEKTNSELSLYPVAIMPWKLRKNFIYANAEITQIIKNQQYINKMQAMRQMHTMMMSMPKFLYDKTKIQGMTNQIGGMHGVNGDISNTMQFVQPKDISIDVDKAITDVVELTREFKGLNENILGISRPENTSALIAQQKASAVPLETIKRRFYTYLEDVSAIWLDFYKNKYKMARKVLSKDKEDILSFTGTDLKDVYLKTKVDIGASTQYSELSTIEVLDQLLSGGHINITQYLERYPADIIPRQDELIDELGGAGDIDRKFKFEMMARVLDQLDDETKATIMNMEETEREKAIMRMSLEQGVSPIQGNAPAEAQNVSQTRSNPEKASVDGQQQQQQMNRAGVKQQAVTQQQQGMSRNV